MKNIMLTIGLLFIISLAFSQTRTEITNNDEPKAQAELNGHAILRGAKTVIGSQPGPNWASVELYPNTGTDIGIRFVSYNEGLSTLTHKGAGQLTIKTDDEQAPIYFKTGAGKTNSLSIANDGKIGIGIDKPEYELQVNGKAAKVGSGDWEVASDKNLKKNISDYDMGLDAILKLNPVYFNYNGKAGITDTETRHVGLIAQEFQKVAPYAVKESKYTEMINEDDEQVYKTGKTENYLAIDGSSIRFMLVNAVKEQQQIIEEQKSELAELKTELNNLSEIVKGINNESSTIHSTIKGPGKAFLGQNIPNPLTESTIIEYFIPHDSKKAFLTVQNMSGQFLQRIDITEKGNGLIDLQMYQMPPGVYTYRLKVDGTTVDTKKMIIE